MRSLLSVRGRTTGMLALLALLTSVGCSNKTGKLEQELERVRDDLIRVQAQQDELAEQLAAMQAQPKTEPVVRPATTQAPVAAPERLKRPRLKIIKLTPEGEPEAGMGQTEEGSAAPVELAVQ